MKNSWFRPPGELRDEEKLENAEQMLRECKENAEMTRRWYILGVALVLGTALSLPAQAQDKKGGVIRLEVTTIEGRVQKPNAFFINTRRALVYETLEVKDSFLKEITKVIDSGDL